MIYYDATAAFKTYKTHPKSKVLKHMLLLCPDLRAAAAELKRTLRNLVMAQGHLIMAPIFKLAHQHQSGPYLEELHDLRLCHPP